MEIEENETKYKEIILNCLCFKISCLCGFNLSPFFDVASNTQRTREFLEEYGNNRERREIRSNWFRRGRRGRGGGRRF